MIGRIARINKVLHNLLKSYPEQFVLISIFGGFTSVFAMYLAVTRPINTYRPWYRGYYDVVRPDHQLVYEWRVPEDYPAPYLSNRRADTYKSVTKDYGWNMKLD